jgi:hypothetical protein
MSLISKDYELQHGEEVPKMDTVKVKSNEPYAPIEPLYNNSNKIISDSGRIDWLQSQHTLHRHVEFIYVVMGYQCQLMHDGNEVGKPFEGKTLRDAIDLAMKYDGILS